MPEKFLSLKVLKTKIILVVVLTMAFFVSVGVVLAVNDNANEPLCSTWNCDGSSIICSNVQFDWTSNGYPSGAGNPQCCGDDSYEYYVSRDCDGNAVSFCCFSGKVQNGQCVNECICGDNQGSLPGIISGKEYDYNQSSCTQLNSDAWGLTSGNAGGSCWQGKCCTDDSDEYTRRCQAYSSDSGSFNCSSSDKACCNGDSLTFHCVYNGNCYSGFPGAAYSVGVAPDKKSICYTYGWADCDYFSDPSVCNNVCGYNYAIGGESSSFGEYDSGGATECCGDDANEYYAQLCPGVSGVPRKCCNNSGDKINAAGNCVSSCGQPDLIIQDIAWSPSSPNVGDAVNFTITVKNQGTVNASSFSVWHYLDGVDKDVDNVPSLAAGASANVSWVWTALGGSHTVRSDADAEGQVAESNETNNSRSETIIVNRPPNTPSNPSPSNGAACVSLNPTLSWSGGDPDNDPLTYYINFCQGSGCTPQYVAYTSNTSYPISSVVDLSYNQAYRWRIIADDGKLQTSGSIWSFSTQKCNPSQACCLSTGCDFEPSSTSCGATACSADGCFGDNKTRADYPPSCLRYCSGADLTCNACTSNGKDGGCAPVSKTCNEACGAQCDSSSDTLVSGNTCYYNCNTSNTSCSFQSSDPNKPTNWYSSGGVCYWNCAVSCTTSGWQRTNCSSAAIDDVNSCTADVCTSSGVTHTNLADNTLCGAGNICCSAICQTPVCSSDAGCNDNNPGTIDTCQNDGACSAYCSNVATTCSSNADCNEVPDNSCTNDVCVNPGTPSSYCTNNSYCVGTDPSCGCASCLNCNSSDAWYNTGQTRWIDNPSNVCQEKEQEKWDYRDYYCSGYSCSYSITTTSWNDTGQTRSKADNTACGTGVICCSGICGAPLCFVNGDCDDGQSGTTDTCLDGGSCAAQCQNIQGQWPDLFIEDIAWLPVIPSGGQTANFTVTIKNQGSSGAGNSTVKYYIDDVYYDQDNITAGIPAGGFRQETFSWTASCGHSHEVRAVADANNTVDESNENNNERTETITVVNCAPNAPTLAGPLSGQPGVIYNFTAQATDPDNDNVRYNFDWDDNSSYNTGYVSSGTSQTAGHSWTQVGSYSVCARAADAAVWSSPTCRTINISEQGGEEPPGGGEEPPGGNPPPEGEGQAPLADFDFCLEQGTERTVRFLDQSTDSDGSVVAWDWDFGDGATCPPLASCNETGFSGTNQNPVHTFGAGTQTGYQENFDEQIYDTWDWEDMAWILVPGREVELQAELGEITAPFVWAYDADAYAKHYVWAPNNSGTGGKVEFTFEIEEADEYNLWGIVKSPNSSNDSFYVSMDGAADILWQLNQTSNWQWQRFNNPGSGSRYKFNLSAGSHTLVIKQAEDGAKIDFLTIVRDGESPISTVSPNWYVENGYLVESSDQGQTFMLSPFYSEDNEYEISVDAYVYGGDNNGLGIIFGYQSPDDYYELEFYNPTHDYDRPTKLQLYHYRGWEEKLDSVEVGPIPLEEWHNLKLEISDSGLVAKIDNVPKLNYSLQVPLGRAGVSSHDNDGGVEFDDFEITMTGGGAGGSWWNDDWQYRKQIIFDTSSGGVPWSQTLEAENINHECGGLCCNGIGWNIWSECEIYDNVNFPETTAYQFDIIAKGDFAGGAWPNMELTIDGQVKGSVAVSSSDWQTYTFNVDVSAGSRRLAVAFTNDYYIPGVADRNLYVDKINISGSPQGISDLVDAPVLIKLTNSNFDFSRTLGQGQGQDVRFVDSDNSAVLAHEIEYWNQGQQQAEVWVKVPRIDGYSNSDFIYIYYGGPPGSYQNTEAVWSNNYVMVQHLEETSGTHYDSTQYNNDGIPYNGVEQNAVGKINGADEFDDEDQTYIKINNSPSLNFGAGQSFSVESWVKLYGSPSTQQIFRTARNGSRWWFERIGNNNIHLQLVSNPDAGIISDSNLQNNRWYFAAASRNGSTGELKLYIDGVSEGVQTGGDATVSVTSGENYRIGGRQDEAEFFDGLIDEVRISNTVRSSDWISFQYCSMQQSCLSYGGEEAGGGSFVVTLTATDNSLLSDSIQKAIDFGSIEFCPANQPPSALNLSVFKGDYCDLAAHYFSWRYNDFEGNLETRFRFQVDDHSNFNSPEIDRDFTGLANPSGAENSQNVLVLESPEADRLMFNEDYHWRVMVYDSAGGNSGWIEGADFTTDHHQYPQPDFDWSPQAPAVDEVVLFQGQAQTFGGSSASSWSWTFPGGAPASSNQQNPQITFAEKGQKQVNLTVTDSGGYSCSLEKSVNIGYPLPQWREVSP